MSDTERAQLSAPAALEPPIVGRIWTTVEMTSALYEMSRRGGFGTETAAIDATYAMNHGATAVSHGPLVNGIDVLNLIATPAASIEPFEPDPAMEKSNLLIGSLRTSVLDAIPVTLRLRVLRYSQGQVTPLERACVEVWHADALGVRSGIQAGVDQAEGTCGQSWLHGHQWTDSAGSVAFRTVYPGPSLRRAPHFSVRIVVPHSDGGCDEFKSDLFLDDFESDLAFAYPPYRSGRRKTNADDPVFDALRSDGSKVGGSLMVHLDGTAATGYTADFAVALAID